MGYRVQQGHQLGDVVPAVIGELIGEAHTQLDIPAPVAGEALWRSAITNVELVSQAAKEFFSRLVPREPDV